MKRKNLNALKPKNFFIQDLKFSETYKKFKSILSHYKKNNSYAIAVSGGPDSMALAAMANHLKSQKNAKMYYLHVDHGLRKNSGKEAIRVRSLLKKKGINLRILKNKNKFKSNIQKNARDIRYKLLVNFCYQKKIKNLVTAHQKDDQIENFLIRLSRGSGVEGLSSMDYSTKISKSVNLLRPFLDFKKDNLLYISAKFFKKTIKDPSNKNRKFLRTNIRELTKILEQKGLKTDQIIKSIKNISSSKDAINFYVSRSLKKFVKFKKKETVLNLDMFKKEPKEIKFKIINNIVKNRTSSYYPPRSKKVINLINRFEGTNLKKCTLGGCIFEKRKNLLHVTKEL